MPIRLKDGIACTASVLRAVHRRVRRLHQRVAVMSVLWPHGDAHAGRDLHELTVHRQRLSQRPEDAAGGADGIVTASGQEDCEFIPTQTGDRISLT